MDQNAFWIGVRSCRFARMTRQLASSLSFFDDILVHSDLFREHLSHVRQVLHKLRTSGLTAKPSKITAGCESLEFLGHVIGKGLSKPDCKKKSEKDSGHSYTNNQKTGLCTVRSVKFIQTLHSELLYYNCSNLRSHKTNQESFHFLDIRL